MVGRRVILWARDRWAMLALSGFAACLIFGLAVWLFPYHSSNHDEAVYLQQAGMLLAGQLHLVPPVDGAFRPWFFVAGDTGLYSKYSPVPAGVFALGLAIGEPRISLAVVAAGNTALCIVITRHAFDRLTGLAAGVFLLTAPLFIITSAVFLPYAPTFFLNLAFAYSYIRMCRDASSRWAALAGGASGLAFFARPYTAVLFAVPFAIHALWLLYHKRSGGRHLGVLTGVGLAGVAVTLSYNVLLTGDPLTFPYLAFAPQDGLGFGDRQLLEHSMTYTPRRAVYSNAVLLWYLVTRWGPIGVVGTGVAILGVIKSRSATERAGDTWLSDRQLRAVLLGIAGSFVIGNLYFWGNANILGTPTDPSDGLVAGFGPYYHFDVLLPLATFAGYGVISGMRTLHTHVDAVPRRHRRVIGIVLLLTAGGIAGVGGIAAFGPPLEQHAAYTEEYENAYEPFEPTAPQDAVVLLPTPFGPWLNHPFQPLRNTPGFDGPTVYALDRDAETTWSVLAAYSDRTPYRYRYRGVWGPDASELTATLQRLDRLRGREVTAATTVGLPRDTTSVTLTVSAAGETARTTRIPDDSTVTVEWRVTEAAVTAANLSVPIDGPSRAVISVIAVDRQGGPVTYEIELLVRPRADGVAMVWPPEPQVCLAAVSCEEPYIAGEADASFIDLDTVRQ